MRQPYCRISGKAYCTIAPAGTAAGEAELLPKGDLRRLFDNVRLHGPSQEHANHSQNCRRCEIHDGVGADFAFDFCLWLLSFASCGLPLVV